MPTSEDQVLLAVHGGATKATDIKGKLKAAERGAAIAELVKKGLLVAAQKGRSIELSLTESGRAAAAVLQAATAASAPAPAAPRAPAQEDRLARLESVLLARITDMETKLDAVLALVSPSAREKAKEPPAGDARPPLPLAGEGGVRAASLRDAILGAVRELDRRHRHGGLVPIPVLRRELLQLGVQAGDAEVNSALIALERDYVVDLLVAQSPTALPDRAAGIERPGRGLAYYVAPRNS